MTPSPWPSRRRASLRRGAMGLLLLCGSGLLWQTAHADSRPTGARPNPVSSIENELEFDENHKLAKHYVVFPANRPDCPTHSWETGESRPGSPDFIHVALEGEALKKVFPHYRTGLFYDGQNIDYTEEPEDDEDFDPEDDDRCLAACLEMGTDQSVAGNTMPHFHFQDEVEGTTLQQKGELDAWFHDKCNRMEVCFINYVVKERPLTVYWINKKTNTKHLQIELEYSERKTRCFHSFYGHEFEIIDEESGFRETFTVQYITTKAFGTSPPSSSQRFDGIDQVERDVKNALNHEWRKHGTVKRTFSSLGFAKGRLPDDVFANMGAFYYNNRHHQVNEEWEGKGVFVNWWETDVKFIAIPWGIKHFWQIRLSQLVSEWAGVEVEETSMYGLRSYQTGARLLSHVDRLPTHAVSLIVNVAQENLANPWPVEVFDHADRLHEVDMVAGDIVYYESAKNLHSRNRPLTCKPGGCQFINLFTHYRPVDDGSNWYNVLDDMPNRPPPLLEGQVAFDADPSTCQRRPTQIATNDSVTDNVLGIGQVACSDPQLGPYVSPTLYKARGADDLFRWWKATADPNFLGFDEHGNEMVAGQNVYEDYHEYGQGGHVDEDLAEAAAATRGEEL